MLDFSYFIWGLWPWMFFSNANLFSRFSDVLLEILSATGVLMLSGLWVESYHWTSFALLDLLLYRWWTQGPGLASFKHFIWPTAATYMELLSCSWCYRGQFYHVVSCWVISTTALATSRVLLFFGLFIGRKCDSWCRLMWITLAHVPSEHIEGQGLWPIRTASTRGWWRWFGFTNEERTHSTVNPIVQSIYSQQKTRTLTEREQDCRASWASLYNISVVPCTFRPGSLFLLAWDLVSMFMLLLLCLYNITASFNRVTNVCIYWTEKVRMAYWMLWACCSHNPKLVCERFNQCSQAVRVQMFQSSDLNVSWKEGVNSYFFPASLNLILLVFPILPRPALGKIGTS